MLIDTNYNWDTCFTNVYTAPHNLGILLIPFGANRFNLSLKDLHILKKLDLMLIENLSHPITEISIKGYVVNLVTVINPFSLNGPLPLLLVDCLSVIWYTFMKSYLSDRLNTNSILCCDLAL